MATWSLGVGYWIEQRIQEALARFDELVELAAGDARLGTETLGFSMLGFALTNRSALRAWSEHRGFAPAEVMAMGDNLNDLQMLEFAGTPVVMGNALSELKARGWSVTTTNDEAGVARAIEEYILAAGRAGAKPSAHRKASY
jgi:hypothetical protein